MKLSFGFLWTVYRLFSCRNNSMDLHKSVDLFLHEESRFRRRAISAKISILEVWLGSEYASIVHLGVVNIGLHCFLMIKIVSKISKSPSLLFVFGRLCIVIYHFFVVLLFVTLIFIDSSSTVWRSCKYSFYWKLHVSLKDSCVIVLNVSNCSFLAPVFKFIFFSLIKMIVLSKHVTIIDCWMWGQSKNL